MSSDTLPMSIRPDPFRHQDSGVRISGSYGNSATIPRLARVNRRGYCDL